MREMLSMIVVLTVLTAVSGGLLAAVKVKTEPQIEEQVLKFQKAPAIEAIFADATNDPIQERFNVKAEGIELQVFPTTLTDGVKAVAFEAKGTGFGGPIGLMMGVNLDTDEIIAVRVTTHSETPGIGSRAKEDLSFVTQFAGMTMASNFGIKNQGGDIDAMSGATVTSVGVSQAAVAAQDLYKKLKPEIVKHMN
ncbi:electron transporter RnfG [Desulfobacter hydrogenophilus]|uniref:Ion-translocating oxidoreductase complex subunit G n=1 Tax=Desulfobacter hydrogenophilus TaxID=2291 RepID=A0A328F8I6_9BACT|nr:RnfABCDGE type electron transport complex subunit G [Desulfobacter hydrogenophilus]NDY72998.1 RnfABCDGE type electron transport complex subunit G [Desulfobacter hydrogenophilus]QBH15229.1 RnfABCDGE type electron transport complex subunit G [Desulfobacter hydrogenophilus]RAM00941.1 electron transporter RnfG [Desulfobacter hydrogenophilus]